MRGKGDESEARRGAEVTGEEVTGEEVTGEEWKGGRGGTSGARRSSSVRAWRCLGCPPASLVGALAALLAALRWRRRWRLRWWRRGDGDRCGVVGKR